MGELNRYRQEVLFNTGLPSGQRLYAKLVLMHCHDCNNLYMGQDCDAEWRCCPSPQCQYGMPANTMDRGPDPSPIESSASDVKFKCSHCAQTFWSPDMLHEHISRRHR